MRSENGSIEPERRSVEICRDEPPHEPQPIPPLCRCLHRWREPSGGGEKDVLRSRRSRAARPDRPPDPLPAL